MKLFDQNELVPRNSLLREFFGDNLLNELEGRSTMPAINISEKEDKYVVDVAAPGLKKEDFDIELDNDMMTISAEKKEEVEDEGENFRRKEFNYTSFRRSFRLPENSLIDQIDASYKDGILSIDIPKDEALETHRKKIEIH
jgi:HSP20 family protein